MVLSISYNCFDGMEILPFLIPQIREYVDIIIINFQTYSYYGNKCKDEDLEIVNDLYRKGLVNKINDFKIKINAFAKTPQEAKELERKKEMKVEIFVNY